MYQFLMILLLLPAGAVGAPVTTCGCRAAADADRPQNGNELVTMTAPPVRTLTGIISGPNAVPLEEVVVEVYAWATEPRTANDRNLAVKQKRWSACITGAGGQYRFTGLPDGWYVMRAGMRTGSGFNITEVVVRIDGTRKPSRTNQGVDIELNLAT